MFIDSTEKLDIIVDTLLLVSDRVFEISPNLEIIKEWEKENSVNNLTITNHHILSEIIGVVQSCYISGKSITTEFISNTHKGDKNTITVKLLPNHPVTGHILVVVEFSGYTNNPVSASAVGEHKNINNQIEQQRYFYETILNNIPADIAIFDPLHRYIFVNKNAFKNDELRKWIIGKTDVDYAKYSNRPDSFHQTRFELYERAERERKASTMIEKLIDKEGKVGYHLRILHPIFNSTGKFEFILAYGVIVTDLIQAQEDLKTSVDTFSAAFNQFGTGMALLDTDGRYIDVNSVVCEMSGYTKEELLNLTHMDIAYEEDRDIDNDKIEQLLNKEIQSYTIEKRFVSKSNKIVLILLTVSLVWNNDGTPKFYVAHVIDITQRKQLEDKVFRKNISLESTRNSLVNKVNQLEELNRIIAHNLRGPAKNIEMLVNIILAKLKGGIYAERVEISDAFTLDESLEMIEESSNSLIDSLNTLMEITQIKLNKDIPTVDCNFDITISEITKQIQGVIYEKNASIICNLEINSISYPKAYLESIIYNLISNALKYSKPNETPEIIISTYISDGRVHLSVKDNGLGINIQKHGKKIFLLNQVFHSGYDSKGIGLYITRTQIESLGGSIDVKSQENEGSEFIVKF